jgi:hypothetical protein
MAIRLSPFKSHKKFPWLDPARIDRHSINRDIRGGIAQVSTQDSGQVTSSGQGHRHWG